MSISSDSSDEEIVVDVAPVPVVVAPVVVEPKKKRAYVRKTPLTVEAKEKQCLQLQKAREARKKPVVAWAEPVEPDSPIEEPVREKKVKKEKKPVKEKPVKEAKPKIDKPVKEPKKPKKEKPVEVHHHHYPADEPPPMGRSMSTPMTFA